MTTPSEQFHIDRRSGIGGSDAASILGISQYGTPLGVWMSKMGLTEPGADSEPAEWGRILEPKVLEQYAIREDYFVLGRNTVGGEEVTVVYTPDGHILTEHPIIDEHGELMGLLRHPDHEFMIAHLDGIAFRYFEDAGWKAERGIDAKTTNAFNVKKWDDEGEMPVEYAVQVHHYQMVLYAITGWLLPFDVPVLIGGQKWKVPTLEYDEKLAEMMLAREEAFWNDFVKAEMPPPSMPTDNMAKVYPKEEEGKEIIAAPNPDLEAFAVILLQRKVDFKTAETEKDRIENTIKETMGDAARVTGDGWHITWKKSKDREKIDWETVAREIHDEYLELTDEILPTPLDMFAGKHTTTSPGPRVFRANLKGLNPDE